jgi:hypothetical protein
VPSSSCNLDYGPSDECQGCDDRDVVQAMELLRRLSVNVLVERCVCDCGTPIKASIAQIMTPPSFPLDARTVADVAGRRIILNG